MKCLINFIVVFTVCFSISLAAAQNKVVVIPLNSAKKLDNVVTVSAKGGDFNNPVAAVNSITDAAANNPYLVVIGPGAYTLTQTLVMKPYVSIAGAGQEVTTLTGAISAGAAYTAVIVSGADNAALSDLSIENTGGSNLYSTALYNGSGAPVIQDVTATASGGTNVNTGVYNKSSSPIMNNVTATASGGSSSYGVWNSNSSPTIRRCTANGSTNGIIVSSSTVRVLQSSIIGGVGGTTITCVHSDNGVDKELDGNCAVIP